MSYTVKFGGKTYPVASVEEAAAKWNAFRDHILRNNCGGVRSIGNGLKVKDERGTVVATVSYNGRIWGPEGWTPSIQ